MKKNFYLLLLSILGLMGVISSCEDNETFPPEVILDETIDYSVKAKDTLWIRPEVKSAIEADFEWYVNESKVYNEKDFPFVQKEKGIYKIKFITTNADGEVEKNFKITVKELLPPVIEFDETLEYNVTINDTLWLKPEVTSATDAAYTWYVNNEEVFTHKDFPFSQKEMGIYDVQFKVKNEDGEETKNFQVSVKGPYSNGTFILNEGNMTNETGIVSFIDRNGVITDSIYQKANPGSKLGNVAQDMFIANGKIYFVSQNGQKNGGGGYIIITDAETLKKESEITEGFTSSDWPTHIVVCNESKAYVRSNAGLHILDLNTNKITGLVEGANSANKQKMEFINNCAIVPAAKEILIINPTTDKIEKRIDLGGSISGIIEGKDKCIWAAVHGDIDEFVKIETSNFEITQRDAVDKAFSLAAGWIPSIGLCASLKDNSLYWRKGATVYRHTTEGNITTSTFVNMAEKFTDAKMIYGDINIDPVTNELYVCTIKGYGMSYLTNGIYVIDGETGEPTREYYKNHIRFSAGVFFTESFRN